MLDAGVVEQDAPGGIVVVSYGTGDREVWTSGSADSAGQRPIAGGEVFKVGSITKTLTATVVLQLAAEGRLSLDEPIARWRDDVPDGDEITLTHLLSHTSGLGDHWDSEDYRDRWHEPWTADEMIAVGLSRDAKAEPGCEFVYNNTAFLLLGQVIEAELGQPWETAVRERVLAPAGLDETWLTTTEEVPGGITTGWIRVDGAWTDATADRHPSTQWSAGAAAATGADLVDWARALFTGDLLDDEHLALMTTPIELATGETYEGYAHGMSLRDGPMWGHVCLATGYTTSFGYRPREDLAVAVLLNADEGRARAIEYPVWDVLTAPF